jgi:steroid 5-alpha reductase family enzyme
MGLAALLASSLALSLGAMLLLWLLSLRLRDASIVDIWWGPGFAAIAVVTFELAERGHALATSLTVVWGLRLGLHLARRNLGRGEDPRYAAMRRRHGERFGRVSLFSVFGMQGLLMWLVSLPVQVANAAGLPAQLGVFEAAGALLWCVGLFFEGVGDWQLARFRADPANAGRVMERGLWRYTRHPNYFGDCCVWWGIFLAALPAPGAWLTAASPALMTFLLLRVSGVPLLERSLRKRRPGYEDYARRTSPFLPLPPRKRGRV